MRLAINATSLLSPVTGIGQYVRNLGMSLGSLEADLDVNYFLGFGWSRDLPQRPARGIGGIKRFVKAMIPNAYWAARTIQQAHFTAGARGKQFDLYHEPSFIAYRFDGPVVLTVHDLSHLRFPSSHPSDRVRYLNKLLPCSLDAASRIIADSEYVRHEVISEFGVAPAKISAISLAASEAYRPRIREEVEQQLSEYGLAYRRFILAVGTLEPRKNLVQALRAYSKLPNQLRRHNVLVVAGMKGWLTEGLEREMRPLLQRGELTHLGYVPDEVLPSLYASATMLLYPSLYEGFGLPLLEAMASGTPVITTNVSSVPEVVGKAAILVDPHDVDGLTQAMRGLLEDPVTSARYAALGIERAKQFSWRKCASETIRVYREALTEYGRGA